MNGMSFGEAILSDPVLYASLQSTIRHYLSGYLHQFLVTYADGLVPAPLSLDNMWHVLNVPCCSGDWVCDIAYQNPLMEVVGIDPDPRRITFAQAQASAQGIANATFQVGRLEALSPPDQYYDLLHIRFIAPLTRPDAWARITANWWELCRPGGLVMWTEMHLPATNSAAFADWCSLLGNQKKQKGMTADITPCMVQLLDSAGFQNARQTLTTIDISSNTRLHKHVSMHIWDILNFVHCNLLFAQGASPSALQELYEQMIQDFLADQFQGNWTFETYLAIKEI
jgi:ubiquinone/menaquinone biosynthesis C-methylase UbiE